MFCSAFRPFSSLRSNKRACTARYFHRVITDFVTRDTTGNLVTQRVPIVIGNLGEAYIMIEREIGSAFRAANPLISTSTASAEDRCNIMFFHDLQYFGFGPSSYPRLHTPNQISRQTESNTSPATLLLDGVMNEIVLDGTPDAMFAELARWQDRDDHTLSSPGRVEDPPDPSR